MLKLRVLGVVYIRRLSRPELKTICQFRNVFFVAIDFVGYWMSLKR